jgi:hypothetical protein
MKFLLLALAFISTSLTVAAPAFADLDSPVVSIRGNRAGLVSVDLLADGQLVLVNEKGVFTKVTISKAASAEMLDKAKRLTNVHVTIKDSPVVCMVAPPPELADLFVATYDYNTHQFQGEPNFILSAEGCHVSHRAIPDGRNALSLATELRAQMLILALQLKP